jgi:hypothetical protein
MNYQQLVDKNRGEFLRLSQDEFARMKAHASAPLWHALDVLGQYDPSQFLLMARHLPEYAIHIFGQEISAPAADAKSMFMKRIEEDYIYAYAADWWKRYLRHMEFVEKNRNKKTSKALINQSLLSLLGNLKSINGLAVKQDHEERGIDVISSIGEIQITHYFEMMKPFEISLREVIKTKNGDMLCPSYNYFAGLGIGPTEFWFYNNEDWQEVEPLLMHMVNYIGSLFDQSSQRDQFKIC